MMSKISQVYPILIHDVQDIPGIIPVIYDRYPIKNPEKKLNNGCL